MRKTLFVLCALMLVTGLLMTVGCGSSTEKSESEETEVVSLDEDVATGIVGTYVENSGGSGSIVLQKGGTFEGNAWGSEKKGTYKVEEKADDTNAVVLKFEGSDATETWGVGISMGKVVAVTSPDGVQYDKVEK